MVYPFYNFLLFIYGLLFLQLMFGLCINMMPSQPTLRSTHTTIWHQLHRVHESMCTGSCYRRLCEDWKLVIQPCTQVLGGHLEPRYEASYESCYDVRGDDAGSSFLQGSKRVSVQLDCSRSTNAVVSRESSVHVLEVMPNSIIVSLHNWETVVHIYSTVSHRERREEKTLPSCRWDPLPIGNITSIPHPLCIH